MKKLARKPKAIQRMIRSKHLIFSMIRFIHSNAARRINIRLKDLIEAVDSKHQSHKIEQKPLGHNIQH